MTSWKNLERQNKLNVKLSQVRGMLYFVTNQNKVVLLVNYIKVKYKKKHHN